MLTTPGLWTYKVAEVAAQPAAPATPPAPAEPKRGLISKGLDVMGHPGVGNTLMAAQIAMPLVSAVGRRLSSPKKPRRQGGASDEGGAV